MTDTERTPWPAVGVERIRNGDQVVVTGELKPSDGPLRALHAPVCARCNGTLVGMRAARKYQRRYYACSTRKRYGPEDCNLPLFHVEAVEEAAKLVDQLSLPRTGATGYKNRSGVGVRRDLRWTRSKPRSSD